MNANIHLALGAVGVITNGTVRDIEEVRRMKIKALESVAPVHKKQLLTYLKLADKRLGPLVNFNVTLIKHRIARIVNGLQE